MVCNKKRKPVFIKRKWNHVVFSRATILSFHPVLYCDIVVRELEIQSFSYIHFQINTLGKGMNSLWVKSNTTILLISLVGSVFANGPGDLGSIPGHVILKTLRMELDISLLNTQEYKVRIKGKVEQSRERSSTHPNTLM